MRRVLRVMREAELWAPASQPPPVVERLHEGTIVTDRPNVMWGTDPGMSRALLKLSGRLVHDYATISDDSPSPNRASRARRAATSAGIS